MKTHYLKIRPDYFAAVANATKTFEIRFNGSLRNWRMPAIIIPGEMKLTAISSMLLRKSNGLPSSLRPLNWWQRRIKPLLIR